MSGTLIADRELQGEQLAQAEFLQRRGYTLSEIATHMGIERTLVVDALYTAKVERRTAPVAVAPPPPIPYAGKSEGATVRLRRGDGHWLHMGGDRMTLVRADAWIGTRRQLDKLCETRPHLRLLNVVRE